MLAVSTASWGGVCHNNCPSPNHPSLYVKHVARVVSEHHSFCNPCAPPMVAGPWLKIVAGPVSFRVVSSPSLS
eukprot:9358946-Pyramimonas_sp.AAC.6